MWIIERALIPRMTPGSHALLPFVAILIVVLILLLERMYREKHVIRLGGMDNSCHRNHYSQRLVVSRLIIHSIRPNDFLAFGHKPIATPSRILFDDWITRMVADILHAFPASLRSVAVEGRHRSELQRDRFHALIA